MSMFDLVQLFDTNDKFFMDRRLYKVDCRVRTLAIRSECLEQIKIKVIFDSFRLKKG